MCYITLNVKTNDGAGVGGLEVGLVVGCLEGR